jgi:hypothetical protein
MIQFGPLLSRRVVGAGFSLVIRGGEGSSRLSGTRILKTWEA